MLSKRLIACLDVRNGCVVKGVNFEALRDAGDPAALAKRYNREGIDEVVVLDVTATLEGRRAFEDTIRAVSRRALHSADRRRRHPDARPTPRRRSTRAPTKSASTARRSPIPRCSHASPRDTAARRSSSRSMRSATPIGSGSSREAAARRRARDAVEWARRSRSARRGRNPPDVDRSRRHARGLRLRADRRGVERGLDPGDRVRRRRHVRTLHRRVHGGPRRRGARRLRLSLLRARRRRL